MIIRTEQPADYARIAEVVEAAFRRPNEAKVVEDIRVSEHYVPELALVAEEDGVITGHVMLSYVTLRGEEEWQMLCLAPLSVVPERQKQGIGGALIGAGVERAEAMSEPLILLLGHPEYYPRFGFERARPLGIEPPSPAIPEAAFMVLRLSRYDERYRGRVSYPPAFDET